MTLIAGFKYPKWLKEHSLDLREDAPDHVKKAYKEWIDLYHRLSTPGYKSTITENDEIKEINLFD